MPPKVALRVALATIVCIFLISCQKETSTETPPPQGPNANGGYLRMKVNGVLWEADLFSGASIMNGLLNVSGVGKDKKTFTMTLLDDVARPYTLDIPSTDGAAVLIDSTETNPLAYATNQGSTPAQAGGTAIVTKIDTDKKTVSGTFQFRMFREMDGKQVIISEGVFENLPYTTTLPPASGTDTLSVKVDGTVWKPESIFGAVAQNSVAIVGNNLAGNRTVGLVMPLNITPGTYDLDFLGATYIGQYNPTASTYLASESGKLTILEHNTMTKRIRGNFNFIAKDLLGGASATLTEGYFSIKYQ